MRLAACKGTVEGEDDDVGEEEEGDKEQEDEEMPTGT